MARVVQVRKEVFDRVKRDFTIHGVDSEHIKAMRSVGGAHSATHLYRKTVGAGSALRITYQAFGRVGGSPAAAAGKLFLVDREGTFDFLYSEAAGREALAAADELTPIHEVQGSFRVLAGSQAAGTLFYAYEGVIHRGGTETVTA